jgi:predicted Zn-dependent peptidase
LPTLIPHRAFAAPASERRAPARDPDAAAVTVVASVFMHSGSQHESARESGISHAVEHMVFKGTASRDARRINLDAERLGAEVNAHTDKDHTAFHMRGLPQHLAQFVPMLAELVLTPTFPADELEREREVLLHEFTEDDDDPLSTAFKLFDKQCWGKHPVAQPVIGSRRNLQRFTRDELVHWVRRHYTARRCVVGVAGPVDPDEVLRLVQAGLSGMPLATNSGAGAGLARRRAQQAAGRLQPVAPGAGLSDRRTRG